MKRVFLTGLILLCGSRLVARDLHVPTAEYAGIQSAIDAAEEGDTVIVWPGTYNENISFLDKNLTLRSVDPNDPNVVAATVIDGSNPEDPNIGSVVTFAGGQDGNSVLTGFTIRGGTGTWLAVAWQFRGLRWNRCGGGVVCHNLSAPTMTRNVFVDNLAGQGGGIYIYGDPVNPDGPVNPAVRVRPVIADNIFMSNFGVVEHGFDPPDETYPANDHGDGGAIVAFQGCDPVITGNVIKDNHADFYGGGLHLRQWSNGVIEGNRIIGNDSALGAGVHITYTSSPVVRGNVIEGNTAGGLGGGGIYVYFQSNPLVEQNVIRHNSSTNGAGMAVFWDSSPVIRNNLIYRNRSGPGIRIVGSSPAILHNTITGNHHGGIDCAHESSPVIENNMVTSNGSGWGVLVHNNARPVIRYNNFRDNGSGAFGPDVPDAGDVGGNIAVPPRFVDADANDYHLDYDSMCINAGDPNLSASVLQDFDGRARVLGQFVDIGAYEAEPVWNVTSGRRYGSIQAAVDDANTNDVVVVTIGTHTGPGNRDIDFAGRAVVVQSAEASDPAVVGGTIIDCGGSGTEPHRGFDFHSGEGEGSIVRGLTIINGGGVGEGGAVRCSNRSGPTISRCVITGNRSEERGGAISCRDGSNPSIVDCVIAGNGTGAGGHGGGIFCGEGSDAIIANCFVAGNSAGRRGGGLGAEGSSPELACCTVAGNGAEEGGGVSSSGESHPAVSNCILWDNRASDGAQIALVNAERTFGVRAATEMTVVFSDVEGGRPGVSVDGGCELYWGKDNLDADPDFAAAGYWDDGGTPGRSDDFYVVGDFHLLPDSGCIDAGANSLVPVLLEADLDGEERFFGGTVDMGADEVVTNPVDLNNDGVVDYLELAVLAGEWLRAGGQLRSDFCADWFVDLADYAELAGQWLWKGRWHR
jgi:parallel beta-helix repeat protein/predicted outer membrane repeat protein